MYLIKEITDHDAQTGHQPDPTKKYKLRKAVRAILRYQDKIALLHVSNKNYYKVPGGGMEDGEDKETTLKREVIEETGCQCQIIEELGVTLEYRDQIDLIQVSYVFVADVVGEPGTPHMMEDEIADGFEVEWFSKDEIKAALSDQTPQSYTDKFAGLRDKSILEYYLEN